MTTNRAPETDALTVAQVAVGLNCSRRTVLRAIRRGELPAVRVGWNGAYRIPAAALPGFARPALVVRDRTNLVGGHSARRDP